MRFADFTRAWRLATSCGDLCGYLLLLLQLAAQTSNMALGVPQTLRDLAKHGLKSSDPIHQDLLMAWRLTLFACIGLRGGCLLGGFGVSLSI